MSSVGKRRMSFPGSRRLSSPEKKKLPSLRKKSNLSPSSDKNLDKSARDLIKKATDAREMAYAPYSKFKVGCALLTKKGNVYTGCNVENSSLGLAICAERTAIVKAVSSGDSEIVKMAIVADGGNEIVTPCGACRQFIYEFSASHNIVLYNADVSTHKTLTTTINELLPFGFRLHN